MESRSLPLLAVLSLLAGLAFWPRVDATLMASQLPSPNGPLYDGFPPPGAPVHLEDLVPVTPFPGTSSIIVIAANGTTCIIDGRGTTSFPFAPLGTSFRGPINLGIGLFGPGNDQPLVFAGPATASTHPVTAFALGPPQVDLGELGQVTGQETAAGVVIASGNFTADGTHEIAFATGPGIQSALHLVDTGSDDVLTYLPFGPDYSGGLHLAFGDLDGSGYDELIVGQASNGGRIRIYSLNGTELLLRMEGEPLGPGFSGGVFPSVFDLNNDGTDDLIVSPGSGPPRVRAFNFKIAETETPRPAPRVIFEFNFFEDTRTNGVRVAAGLSEGKVVLAAATLNELTLQSVRTGPDPFAILYAGQPFGRNATALDVKMTPPR